jgi:ribosomal protein S18 acetylase RimI-like enzyme
MLHDETVSDDDITVRHLGSGDDSLITDAAALFDGPPQQPWIASFLREPTHHLLIAYRSHRAVGFVTGVETTHPDKGTEMFIYELGVDPDERRRGVASALLRELTAIARRRGCYGMWVLTDTANVAAVRAYRSAGATPDGEHLMLSWDLSSSGTITPA